MHLPEVRSCRLMALSECIFFPFLLKRFIMLLTEHLVRCETGGIDVFTPWYKSCIERLQQIFLQVSALPLLSWKLWAGASVLVAAEHSSCSLC